MSAKAPSSNLAGAWQPRSLVAIGNYSLATVVTSASSTVPQNSSNLSAIMTSSSEDPLPVWHVVLFGFLAACIGIVTVGGNLIVILSFVLERSIRQPANYFIASLAVSDLLIGAVSMPLYTVYLLSGQRWRLGAVLCDLWLSVDYTACLCSIYTVFCITADRFCSVKLPAKYRKWRTGSKIVAVVVMTWTVPMVVFFTSIFGWQHFVGRRTVPRDRCYVQYMDDALFNCFLQIGYFWITLTAMFVLYGGIYRVALDLHRRSAAQREKTMSCLVSMAGRTVTQIGSVISITRNPYRLDQFPGRRWDAIDSGSGSANTPANPYLTPGSGPYFQFLFAGNESRSGRAKPGQNDDLDSPRRVDENDVIDYDGTSLNAESCPVPESPAIESSHVTGNHKFSTSDRSAQIPTSVPTSLPAIDKEPVTSTEPSYADNEIAVAMTTTATTDGVAMERAPFDQASSEPETHELEVLLPAKNPGSSESGICPKRLNRFRVAGAVRRLNPFALSAAPEVGCSASVSGSASGQDQLPVERVELPPIHEIEHQRKKRNDDIIVTADRRPRPNVPEIRLPVSSKRARDDVSSDDDDDSDDDNNRKQNKAAGTPIPSSAAHSPFAALHHLASRHHHGASSSGLQVALPQPVARLIRCGLRGARHPGDDTRSAELQQRRNDNRTRKALRTITLILGAFVVCWIPWHVLSLIMGFCPGERHRCVKPVLYDVSYWLCYLNSPINPFCYAFANQQFKKTFIRIIRLDWRRNN